MLPYNYEKAFIEGGYRGVEKYFLHNKNVDRRNRNFLGDALKEKRKAYRAEHRVTA